MFCEVGTETVNNIERNFVALIAKTQKAQLLLVQFSELRITKSADSPRSIF